MEETGHVQDAGEDVLQRWDRFPLFKSAQRTLKQGTRLGSRRTSKGSAQGPVRHVGPQKHLKKFRGAPRPPRARKAPFSTRPKATRRTAPRAPRRRAASAARRPSTTAAGRPRACSASRRLLRSLPCHGESVAAARSNGGAPGICMTAFSTSTRVPTRTPAVDEFYQTQAPRPAAPEPPGLRGLDGFGGRLRPPARAALRAAGAHLRGSGALSGPGAASFSVSATGKKEAAAEKAWGTGEGHRATKGGLGRPLPHRDGRRVRFGVEATSRRLQLPNLRCSWRPARGARTAGGGAVTPPRRWRELVASRPRRAPRRRRRAVVSTTASARRRGGCATLATGHRHRRDVAAPAVAAGLARPRRRVPCGAASALGRSSRSRMSAPAAASGPSTATVPRSRGAREPLRVRRGRERGDAVDAPLFL